jgi:hypothetical protein
MPRTRQGRRAFGTPGGQKQGKQEVLFLEKKEPKKLLVLGARGSGVPLIAPNRGD